MAAGSPFAQARRSSVVSDAWASGMRVAVARIIGLGSGLGGERSLHLRGRYHLAVRHGENIGIQAVRLGDLGPALAELAGAADNHLVAARKKVGDGVVQRAGRR